MKKYYKSILTVLTIGLSVNANAQETTFEFTGDVQSYTVPPGVETIQIEAWGAAGGTGTYAGITPLPGKGGYSIGKLDVTPGQVLEVYVGGEGAATGLGGYNGGGQAGTDYGASGGGASDVRISPYGLTERVIVAGGGGGAAYGSSPSNGGDGGGLEGVFGQDMSGFEGGGGGTQIAGGAAGCCYGAAAAGEFGVGGGPGDYHNAGGGGGWYGGGSGAGQAAAGGGSSYIDGLEDASTTAGLREGNGQVIITVLCLGLTLEEFPSEICFGEAIVFEASSETGGTITWSDGIENGVSFTPDAVGTIVYTATSSSEADCDATVEITVIESPTVDSYVSTDEIIGGDGEIDITVSGGAPGYLYDWDNDGTGDFDDSEDLTGLDGGLYTVVVQDENGCEVSSEIEVNSQLSINDIPTAQVLVFPNPTTSVVQIQFNGQFDYQVLTVDGKVLLMGNGFNNIDIDLEDFSSGTYLLELKSNNQLYQSKIIKE
ncbi:glycine-rich protein [Crocinitomix algicola]|uniref:glycine-rich protein n=1 Tax=Crocinitomix algicola TaxID=1740263 RepID=UPI0008729FA0|nr:glycine-rich protein [Crocinitomix algicola]